MLGVWISDPKQPQSLKPRSSATTIRKLGGFMLLGIDLKSATMIFRCKEETMRCCRRVLVSSSSLPCAERTRCINSAMMYVSEKTGFDCHALSSQQYGYVNRCQPTNLTTASKLCAGAALGLFTCDLDIHTELRFGRQPRGEQTRPFALTSVIIFVLGRGYHDIANSAQSTQYLPESNLVHCGLDIKLFYLAAVNLRECVGIRALPVLALIARSAFARVIRPKTTVLADHIKAAFSRYKCLVASWR